MIGIEEIVTDDLPPLQWDRGIGGTSSAHQGEEFSRCHSDQLRRLLSGFHLRNAMGLRQPVNTDVFWMKSEVHVERRTRLCFGSRESRVG